MNLAIIGAHPGDVEFVSGALIHKYVRAGHRVHTIVMTNADHGHPFLPPEIYGKQTREESRNAAEILHTELHFFERSSGSVALNNERVDELAGLLKEINPDCIITHGPESFHKDHTVTNWLVRHTLYLNRNLSRIPVFYPENREDNRGFRTEYYISVNQDDLDAWEQASMCFECFREGFYHFDYHGYYKQLFSLRGAEAQTRYAVCYMRGNLEAGLQSMDAIPGFPL